MRRRRIACRRSDRGRLCGARANDRYRRPRPRRHATARRRPPTWVSRTTGRTAFTASSSGANAQERATQRCGTRCGTCCSRRRSSRSRFGFTAPTAALLSPASATVTTRSYEWRGERVKPLHDMSSKSTRARHSVRASSSRRVRRAVLTRCLVIYLRARSAESSRVSSSISVIDLNSSAAQHARRRRPNDGAFPTHRGIGPDAE